MNIHDIHATAYVVDPHMLPSMTWCLCPRLIDFACCSNVRYKPQMLTTMTRCLCPGLLDLAGDISTVPELQPRASTLHHSMMITEAVNYEMKQLAWDLLSKACESATCLEPIMDKVNCCL